jgi:hypothetical protein
MVDALSDQELNAPYISRIIIFASDLFTAAML